MTFPRKTFWICYTFVKVSAFGITFVNLISQGQPVVQRRNRGRPSHDEQPQQPPASKKRTEEVRPSTAVRRDMVDHLPQIDQKKEALRCKKKLGENADPCVLH